MPISAEQWRSVVGSNGIKRPRQVGLRGKARGYGSKQLPNETMVSVAVSLINELWAGSTIMLSVLFWFWSYQYIYTGTLKSGNIYALLYKQKM